MLSTLDIIRIDDKQIVPPGPKMVVCVHPGAGLFYRFNSYDEYPIAILIPQIPNHPFLSWDSYIEVGNYPLQLDDFTIANAIRKCGGAPLGKLHHIHVPEICAAIQSRDTLPIKARRAIVRCLLAAIPDQA